MTPDTFLLDRVAQPAVDRWVRSLEGAISRLWVADITTWLIGLALVCIANAKRDSCAIFMLFGSYTWLMFKRRKRLLKDLIAAEAKMLRGYRNPLRIEWAIARHILLFFILVVWPLILYHSSNSLAGNLFIFASVWLDAAAEYVGSCDLPPAVVRRALALGGASL